MRPFGSKRPKAERSATAHSLREELPGVFVAAFTPNESIVVAEVAADAGYLTAREELALVL